VWTTFTLDLKARAARSFWVRTFVINSSVDRLRSPVHTPFSCRTAVGKCLQLLPGLRFWEHAFLRWCMDRCWPCTGLFQFFEESTLSCFWYWPSRWHRDYLRNDYRFLHWQFQDLPFSPVIPGSVFLFVV
jgi:hypothetical protein